LCRLTTKPTKTPWLCSSTRPCLSASSCARRNCLLRRLLEMLHRICSGSCSCVLYRHLSSQPAHTVAGMPLRSSFPSLVTSFCTRSKHSCPPCHSRRALASRHSSSVPSLLSPVSISRACTPAAGCVLCPRVVAVSIQCVLVQSTRFAKVWRSSDRSRSQTSSFLPCSTTSILHSSLGIHPPHSAPHRARAR